jgi:hypothetical protein
VSGEGGTPPRKLFVVLIASVCVGAAADAARYDYRLPATTKTCRMRKDMNEATATRYVFANVMGGKTPLGGNGVVVVMAKSLPGTSTGSRSCSRRRELQRCKSKRSRPEARALSTMGRRFLSPPSGAGRQPRLWGVAGTCFRHRECYGRRSPWRDGGDDPSHW